MRRALEEAGLDVELAAGDADAQIRVASAEGRLTSLPPESQGAVLGLGEPRDALVAASSGTTLDALPGGAAVGVSGPLRRALLGVHRPDAVPREVADAAEALHQLDSGELHAWIAAVAEIRAAGAADRVAEVLEPTSWMAAAGRSAVVVHCDAPSETLAEVLRSMDDPDARAALGAEAAALRELGAHVRAPVGLIARPHGPLLRVRALVPAAEGRRLVRSEVSGRLTEAEEVGRRAGRELVARGALDLLAADTAAPS